MFFKGSSEGPRTQFRKSVLPHLKETTLEKKKKNDNIYVYIYICTLSLHSIRVSILRYFEESEDNTWDKARKTGSCQQCFVGWAGTELDQASHASAKF